MFHSKIYDRFVERQMACTQSAETQKFLLPIWKLRSSFNDALRPVEENMIESMLGRKMLLGTVAIKGEFSSMRISSKPTTCDCERFT